MNEGGELAISGLTVRDSTIGPLVSADSGTVQIEGLDVADSSIAVRDLLPATDFRIRLL